MKRVVLTCDWPGCDGRPVARAYMRVLKRYSRSGRRIYGEESLGSADFCRDHFEALEKATREETT
jgi:hypothetical protein